MALKDSSESRAASVSSMRKTKVPPVWRAQAQLNRQVRTMPTWGVPVGEGQKRTRTGEDPGAARGVRAGASGRETAVLSGVSGMMGPA